MENQDDVAALFEISFPTSPMPAKYVLDNVDQNHEIIQALGKYVLGKSWKDVTLLEWRLSEPSLGVVRDYVTIEAYIYYMPSVLLGALEDLRFMEMALEAILPYNREHVARGKWWSMFISYLSQSRKQCIFKFIEYVERNFWNDVGPSNQVSLFDARAIWNVA